ncbi:AAA family ATPase [Paracidovorax avenae]|uniref:AAA family ATPase n=1 Tax=Paracidovorax avenae TaxID=80867 RepID=UPI001E2B7EC7|nr:AAA family ATPase [Paracidovorax avenae]
MHINPDHFLQTPDGRVFTAERNVLAWRQCREALETALDSSPRGLRVFLLVGAQGAGKTHCARTILARLPNAIVFDAILVRRGERAGILQAALRRGARVIAVVLDTPLDECIARNARRPRDEVVAEQAIRNVHAAIEWPTSEEGFHAVVAASDADRFQAVLLDRSA